MVAEADPVAAVVGDMAVGAAAMEVVVEGAAAVVGAEVATAVEIAATAVIAGSFRFSSRDGFLL